VRVRGLGKTQGGNSIKRGKGEGSYVVALTSSTPPSAPSLNHFSPRTYEWKQLKSSGIELNRKQPTSVN